MISLTIKTDNPKAEIGLFAGDKKLAYKVWQADRQLAETLHPKLDELLKANKLNWQELEDIIVFEGPGSFTGLRIGITVANALAYSLNLPIATSSGEDWIKIGQTKLANYKTGKIALPNYGVSAHTTKPRK